MYKRYNYRNFMKAVKLAHPGVPILEERVFNSKENIKHRRRLNELYDELANCHNDLGKVIKIMNGILHERKYFERKPWFMDGNFRQVITPGTDHVIIR